MDEVYVSDNNTSYKKLGDNDSFDNYYNPLGEDAYLSDVDDISDFKELVDVNGVVHSDEDMIEAYIERGLHGKPFELGKDKKN